MTSSKCAACSAAGVPDAPPWWEATEAAASGQAAASAPPHPQSATATPKRAPPQPPVAGTVAVRPEPGPPGLVQNLLERIEQLQDQMAHLAELHRGLEARLIAAEETAAANDWQAGYDAWS